MPLPLIAWGIIAGVSLLGTYLVFQPTDTTYYVEGGGITLFGMDITIWILAGLGLLALGIFWIMSRKPQQD